MSYKTKAVNKNKKIICKWHDKFSGEKIKNNQTKILKLKQYNEWSENAVESINNRLNQEVERNVKYEAGPLKQFSHRKTKNEWIKNLKNWGWEVGVSVVGECDVGKWGQLHLNSN